jgi:Zn-dependent protease
VTSGPGELELFLYLAPILVASLVLHELAHALVATRLGDPTPREHGRLTLNPIVHLDPLGTAMFAVTYFLSSFIFGWAKPVLVQPQYFRRPKYDMALVAAAGPATNFVIALACVGALVHMEFGEATTNVLIRSYEVNLVLGIFNLLPVPPLDGSRIAGAFMTDDLYARWSAADQYGMFIIFGLIVFFREEFNQLFGSAFEHSTNVMVTLVGG